MAEVGLRELRQNASDVVRRVEAGEEIVVTVAGRPAARMVPIREDRRWRRPEDIAHLFEKPDTTGLAEELRELRRWGPDDDLDDPFERVERLRAEGRTP